MKAIYSAENKKKLICDKTESHSEEKVLNEIMTSDKYHSFRRRMAVHFTLGCPIFENQIKTKL
jgi:hypothetical protein